MAESTYTIVAEDPGDIYVTFTSADTGVPHVIPLKSLTVQKQQMLRQNMAQAITKNMLKSKAKSTTRATSRLELGGFLVQKIQELGWT